MFVHPFPISFCLPCLCFLFTLLSGSTVDVVSELKAELAETVVEEGKASDLGISDDIKEFSTMDGPLIGM